MPPTQSSFMDDIIKAVNTLPRRIPLSDEMPKIQLSNGLLIGNFSSPHPFTFVTGEELPACTKERVRRSSLDITESESPGIRGTTDITIEPRITPDLRLMIAEAQLSDCDIILAPLLLVEAMKRAEIPLGKFRVIRVADRIEKTIYTDRFCL